MKKMYFVLILASIAMIASPIWAESTPEPASIEVAPSVETAPAPIENPIEAPEIVPAGFSSTCLLTTPQCPTGSRACVGKTPGSSCGSGGTCFGLCAEPFVGTVCQCINLGGAPETASADAFVAQLSAGSCQKTGAEQASE